MSGSSVNNGGVQLCPQQKMRDSVFSTKLLLSMWKSSLNLISQRKHVILLPKIRSILKIKIKLTYKKGP